MSFGYQVLGFGAHVQGGDPCEGLTHLQDSIASATMVAYATNETSYELLGGYDTTKAVSTNSEAIKDTTFPNLTGDGLDWTLYAHVYIPDISTVTYPGMLGINGYAMQVIGWNFHATPLMGFRLRQSNGSFVTKLAPTFARDAWYHIWIRCDFGTPQLTYKFDGIEYNPASWDGTFSAEEANIVLGKAYAEAYGNYSFNRVIAWQSSLPDASERTAIEGGSEPTTTPVRYWRFCPD